MLVVMMILSIKLAQNGMIALRVYFLFCMVTVVQTPNSNNNNSSNANGVAQDIKRDGMKNPGCCFIPYFYARELLLSICVTVGRDAMVTSLILVLFLLLCSDEEKDSSSLYASGDE